MLNQIERIPYELEQSEALYWGKLYQKEGKALKIEVNGALCCALPQVEILLMNRVLGWGWAGKESTEDLKRIIAFYQQNGCKRFFVQLSPLVPKKDRLTHILEENGFRLYNKWAKLWRPIVGYLPKVNTFLDIKPIGKEDAEDYGRVIVESFNWTDQAQHLIPFLASSVGKMGYQHYFLYHDHRVVGAGALHTNRRYGSMAFAGILPPFRGMGGQSLLIHQRIKDAERIGIKYLFAEMAENRAEVPAKSFQNLQRFGFDLAYHRENWIYEG